MSLEGVVRDGVVVPNESGLLAEGTRVEITVLPTAVEPPSLQGLLKFKGVASDLPADFAEQHDHYIHGTNP